MPRAHCTHIVETIPNFPIITTLDLNLMRN